MEQGRKNAKGKKEFGGDAFLTPLGGGGGGKWGGQNWLLKSLVMYEGKSPAKGPEKGRKSAWVNCEPKLIRSTPLNCSGIQNQKGGPNSNPRVSGPGGRCSLKGGGAERKKRLQLFRYSQVLLQKQEKREVKKYEQGGGHPGG